MKIIKPFRLSALSRPYSMHRQHRLGVAVFAVADYSGDAPRLDPDYILWRDLLPQLDCEGMIDQFIPKPFAEFLVSGYATTAFQEDKTQCAVRVNIAGAEKSLAVTGDRYWIDNRIVGPEPFERMDICWENAFGGPSFAENQVGKGADQTQTPAGQLRALPNVEGLTQRMGTPGQRVKPAGFGAVPFTRPSRLAKGGTYSEAWLKKDFPGFFPDIDLSIFNAATADQRWGNRDTVPLGEPFSIWNMNESAHCWTGRLPTWRARCFVLRQGEDGAEHFREVSLRATTAWFVPHEKKVILIYHGSIDIKEDDAADIKCIMPALEIEGAPRDNAWYETVLHKRKDPEKGGIYAFRDFELVPQALMNPLNLGDLDVTQLERWKKAQHKKGQLIQEHSEAVRNVGKDPADFIPDFVGPEQQFTPDDIPQLLERTMDLERQAKEHRQTVANAFLEPVANDKPSEVNAFVTDVLEGRTEKLSGPPTPIRQRIEEMLNPDLKQFAQDAEDAFDWAETGTPFTREDQRAARASGQFTEKLDEAKAKSRELVEAHFDESQRRRFEKMEPLNRKMYLYSVQTQGKAVRASDQRTRQLRDLIDERKKHNRDLAMMDMTGADLSGLDLSGMDLSGSFLESADLSGACLSGCDLTETVLARADLRQCDLSHATLVRTNLSEADTEGANFSAAVIDECIIEGTRFVSCRFNGATIQNMIPSGIGFESCDFSRAMLAFISFAQCTFLSNRFDHAQLKKVTFFDSTLTGDWFPQAQLDSSHFVQSRLSCVSFDLVKMTHVAFTYFTESDRCSFVRAHLKQCNLRDMNLERHDFTEACVEMSDFSQANMKHVQGASMIARDAMFVRTDLSDACLRESNLIQTNLKSACLIGADFTLANFFRADMGRARLDGTTVLKGSYIHQANVYPELDHH